MVNLVNQKFTTMMSYYLDLAGSFVYLSSAVLLAAKLKIKSAMHYAAAPSTRALMFSFLMLAMYLILRIILYDLSPVFLYTYMRQNNLFKIALTCLPMYCIASAPLPACGKNIPVRKYFLWVFVLSSVITVGFSLLFGRILVPSHVLLRLWNTLCFSVVSMGFLFLFNVIREGGKRMITIYCQSASFRWTLFISWFSATLAFLLVLLDVHLAARMFSVISLGLYLIFLYTILFRESDVIYSRPGPEEIFSPKGGAWLALEEAKNQMERMYEEIYRKLCLYMDAEKAYRDNGITRSQVASAIGTNTSYLSRSLNEKGGMNFKQFINLYRVQHAQQYYKENPGVKLMDLCVESGFKSITAINLAFHLNLGMTPGEWCRLYTLNKSGKDSENSRQALLPQSPIIRKQTKELHKKTK